MVIKDRLRLSLNDWLLTLLTFLLILIVFVFAPLQASGNFVFHAGTITLLLAVMAGMTTISRSKTALVLMSLALLTNFVVFLERYYYSWPYNLHVLAASWLIIATTLSVVVMQAVFGPGYVTYHRIVGAVLVYLLIAVGFACVFTFLGLSIDGAFKGIEFEDDRSLASKVFYLSFATLTTTGYGDIVPIHPWARSLCNAEAVIGQLYPATLLARLVTLELGEQRHHAEG
ncbi:two pore domain potassium channel family protein [Bradyrhizobium manausense]|uniref:potassium channel family protein n=1 Tax=Bradyrhizobium manausense TaxID=989370 RepID=UPI001BA4889C|nr:potassium channel family protein [Bradyrhizobium manausense]MBR0791787.1 two pore domain potassium channel family protein [Bradyrhizobium manausense]